jgi:hypothetical protein
VNNLLISMVTIEVKDDDYILQGRGYMITEYNSSTTLDGQFLKCATIAFSGRYLQSAMTCLFFCSFRN